MTICILKRKMKRKKEAKVSELVRSRDKDNLGPVGLTGITCICGGIVNQHERFDETTRILTIWGSRCSRCGTFYPGSETKVGGGK